MKARREFVRDMRHTGDNCLSGTWSMAWNYTQVPAMVPGTSVTLLNPKEACVMPTLIFE